MPNTDVARFITALLTGQVRPSGGMTSPKSAAIATLLNPNANRQVNQNPLVRDLGTTSPKLAAVAAALTPNAANVQGGPGSNPKPYAPPTMSGAKHPQASKGGGNLQQAAMAAINAQYGAQAGILNSSIARAQSQGANAKQQVLDFGNRAVGDLRGLYGGLGRDVQASRKTGNQDYGRFLGSTRGNYRALQNSIADNFNSSSGSTAAELQRMGLDPSTALAGAAKDLAFAKSTGSNAQMAALNQGRLSRRDFNANMTGLKHDVVMSMASAIAGSKQTTQTNLSAIANNIADNLFKLRSQQAALAGQRQASLMSLAASQAKANSPDAVLARQYKKAQLAKLLETVAGGGTAGAAKPPTDNIGKALYFLNNDPSTANLPHKAALLNIFNYITTGSGPGKTTQFAKPYANLIWQHLQKTGQKHGWTAAEMNVLQRALQIGLG